MTSRSPDQWIERSVASGGAGAKVGHGLKWAMGGEWLSYVLQIGTMMVLARLLTPEIFGVMAMALTLTVIVDQLRGLGLSQAVIQRDDLTAVQVNALFWVNLAFGVVLAGVVAGMGPVLAAFYDQTQLAAICLVLAAGYLFAGASMQHSALLNRQMAFKSLTTRNMVARLVSSVAAVVAAVAGLGVWSLVIQQVSYLVLAAVFVWAKVRWLPTRPRHLRGALPLVRFGSHIMVANLLHSISRQADNIVIGRMLGAAPLGLYTRAYSLLTLPLRQIKNPISAVMVPILSALQNERGRYRSAYRQSINGLAHAGIPAIVILTVAAPEVIDVFLGSQWSQAATIFQLLAVASLLQLVSTTAGWLFVSFGRGRAAAAWAAFNGIVTVVAFFIGVRWGVEGVAAAYTISQLLLTAPAFVVACRDTPVRPVDALTAVLRPLAVSAVVLAATAASQLLVPDSWPSLPSLGLLALTAVAAWAATMLAWPRARDEVASLFTVLRGRKVRP